MFRYPDFFKVGVSQAGNHDNRVYEDDWAEKWQGLLVKKAGRHDQLRRPGQPDAREEPEGQAAARARDDGHQRAVYSTLLVVDALIKANKDFDLIIFPNRGHGFGSEPYMVRRRWDYFVKHLLGAEPPPNYEMRGPPPARPTTTTTAPAE